MIISNENIEKLKNLIDDAETIGVVSHVNPDGDNLGSSLAFARALRNYGKDTQVVGHDTIDNYLKFLPDLEFYENNYKDSYDLLLILDASELDRIGDAQPLASNSKKTAVVDHHLGGKITSDLNIIHPEAPATCQLIFEIIERMALPLDEKTANLLFTGIVTDTGRFMYYDTNRETFEIAGKLIDLGADKEKIYSALYQNKPINVLQFETDLISNAEFMGDRVFAVASIDKVDEYGVQMGDSEHIANTLRDLEGISISMLLKEYGNGEYKVSMRSKGVDISKTARENGGGGHANASGFSIFDDSLESAAAKAREILQNI
ncbi:bifunctional oligoribonuclease/PAP phosphatase NrnA [uncultured Anaerococcus sp.]|uniref:DHH family phosphoesterase n=1 Tax=uncultured Anaerococcus sp. TaxID=293428 RepID=UPI0025DB033A|nr:bifunctional oligoribonuclease/PAP phosphatase NrnA [uncultured Anaerococcus sp.]